jgi:hypothetical protein
VIERRLIFLLSLNIIDSFQSSREAAVIEWRDLTSSIRSQSMGYFANSFFPFS